MYFLQNCPLNFALNLTVSSHSKYICYKILARMSSVLYHHLSRNSSNIPLLKMILGLGCKYTLRTFSTKTGGIRANQEASHPNIYVYWRRKWQPIPVFLPAEFHGQRHLVGYSSWGCKESDTTEQLI